MEADDAGEILTYVHLGSLVEIECHEHILRSGVFRYTSTGALKAPNQLNPSRAYEAHVVQILLHHCSAGLVPRVEEKRFSRAERRGQLRVVAAPDGRQASLAIQQDMVLSSALLAKGQHQTPC